MSQNTPWPPQDRRPLLISSKESLQTSGISKELLIFVKSEIGLRADECEHMVSQTAFSGHGLSIS